jgi:hypothetical protein
MTTSPPPAHPDRTVDAARLWAGGVATAAVCALVAVVGVLLTEEVVGTEMVHPPLLPVGGTFLLRYALTAAVLALAATALLHLLAMTTPRPLSFFSWIVGVATVVGVVVPLASEGSTAGRVATAVVDLIIGLCVLSLLRSVLARTTRPASRGGRPIGPGEPHAW